MEPRRTRRVGFVVIDLSQFVSSSINTRRSKHLLKNSRLNSTLTVRIGYLVELFCLTNKLAL